MTAIPTVDTVRPQRARARAARTATPHTRELLADSLTPLAVYRRLRAAGGGATHSFLLESIAGGVQVSRFSFIGAAPSVVARLWPDRLDICDAQGTRAAAGAPLAALRELLDSVESAESTVPLTGGWVGFFGYDTIRLVERLPNRPPRDPYGLPYAAFARFDSVVAFDHARQRVVAIANEIEGEVDRAAAERRLDQLESLLTENVASGGIVLPAERLAPAATLPPTLSSDEYQAAVRKAKAYIRAGDIFQVVPARRWRIPRSPGALEVYRALRMVNPSPYMVLLETPEVTLVSSSPEMVVRKSGDVLESRPIAGTRPRGATPAEDHRLAEELLADPKERAEHVMLVDLHRNDLGKVARAASVTVPDFMVVEYYSHLIHIVSSVVAKIRPECSALDALLAAFPAGTLSGAPKIRAMEIIDELEPEARGPYGGAIGYFSFSGDMDTCITIRTVVIKDGEASITAGAGIVADSDPATEVRETEIKAAAMLQALALAAALEKRDGVAARAVAAAGNAAAESRRSR
jgi:anthranilate synthase component 1